MSQTSGEAYDGPARLVTATTGLDVEVRLRGAFQPIDGRYHWHGRVARDEAVDALVASGAELSLVTPHGRASVRLADQDPWGRYRVTGTGRPPYPVDVDGTGLVHRD